MKVDINSVYVPVGGDGYELCAPVNAGDFERLNREIDGRQRASSWNPIVVKVIDREKGSATAIGCPLAGLTCIDTRGGGGRDHASGSFGQL